MSREFYYGDFYYLDKMAVKAGLRSVCHRVGNFIDYCAYELDNLLSVGYDYDNVRNSSELGKTCRKCHKKCDKNYFVVDVKERGRLTLCSKKCYNAAYEQFERYQEALGKDHCIKCTLHETRSIGKKECKLPGCHNKCYITNDGSVYDFCGRSHAKEYGQHFSQSNN